MCKPFAPRNGVPKHTDSVSQTETALTPGLKVGASAPEKGEPVGIALGCGISTG